MAMAMAAAGPGMAQTVTAQTVTGREAKAELFPPEGVQVEMFAVPPLKPQEPKLIGQVAAGYPYYAAVAVAPSEALLKSEATSLAGNYHSVAAASTAALAACNAKRKGGKPCAIAATVKPKDWTDRPLQLSSEATAAMQKDYGRRGKRALAISAGSGAWGLGKGSAAAKDALSGCAAKGSGDCTVVVQD